MLGLDMDEYESGCELALVEEAIQCIVLITNIQNGANCDREVAINN